jgi:hypothetical protein
MDSLNFDCLELLVKYINGQIKGDKLSLETEGKAKEVAFLQGRITGLRHLKSYLISIFLIADSEEEMPDINAMSMAELVMLDSELSVLKGQSDWQTLLERIAQKREELKELLMCEAETSRTLYLAQSIVKGMNAYNDLFGLIETASKKRGTELDFETEEETNEKGDYIDSYLTLADGSTVPITVDDLNPNGLCSDGDGASIVTVGSVPVVKNTVTGVTFGTAFKKVMDIPNNFLHNFTALTSFNSLIHGIPVVAGINEPTGETNETD